MTREDIIRMAIEAELNLYVNDLTEKQYIEVIECFANLVASAEREACAKVCEGIAIEARTLWKARYEPHEDGRSDGAFECAEAIRARGQA